MCVSVRVCVLNALKWSSVEQDVLSQLWRCLRSRQTATSFNRRAVHIISFPFVYLYTYGLIDEKDEFETPTINII